MREDAPDDGRLGIDDPAATQFVDVNLVAAAEAAGTQPGEDLAPEAALGLDLEILEKALRNGAEDASQQGRDLAPVAGVQLL